MFTIIKKLWCRTIQTAIGVFGEEIKGNQVGENKQDSRDHNSLPIIAIELCRERMVIYFKLILFKV